MRRVALAAIVGGMSVLACSLVTSVDFPVGVGPQDDAGDGAANEGDDGAALDASSPFDAPSDASSDVALDADTLASSLIGYWALDDGTGSLALDSSGHSNHGTLKATPLWTTGHLGGALAFDGGQRVEIRTLYSPNFPPSGTLSLWLKGAFDGGAEPSIFDGWSDPGASPVRRHIYVRQGATGWVEYTGVGGFTGQFVVPTDAWTHLIFVWDTVNGIAAAYVDGRAALPTTKIRAGWVPDGQYAVFAPAGCCGGYQGIMDEVRLYDRALSADEIAQIP